MASKSSALRDRPPADNGRRSNRGAEDAQRDPRPSRLRLRFGAPPPAAAQRSRLDAPQKSGATVTFHSFAPLRQTAATSVAVQNGTTITAVTPAGTAGRADVVVTVNGQSGSLMASPQDRGFDYTSP